MEHEAGLLGLKAWAGGPKAGIVAAYSYGRAKTALAIRTRGFVASLLSHPGRNGFASALGPACLGAPTVY